VRRRAVFVLAWGMPLVWAWASGFPTDPRLRTKAEESPTPIVVDLGLAAPGHTWILGAPAKEQLGNHLALGDVNADGVIDLLAGAHWGSEGGRNNVGRAYALFGRATWPAELDLTRERTGLWSFTGEGKEPRLGVSVASGDVSGDGVDDIVIGALLADPLGQANGGAIYVMHGAQEAGGEVDFLNVEPDLLIAGRSDPSGSDQLGTDLVVADLDGDGYDDLVAAAALRNGFDGAVFGWWGPLPPGLLNLQVDDADWWVEGEVERAFFGTALAAGALIEGAGTQLLVGAFAAEASYEAAPSSGAVYVFDASTLRRGGQRRIGEARSVITGPADALLTAAQSFGTCSCHGQPMAVAELTGDGVTDLLLGAPLAAGRAGMAFVVPGPLPLGHVDLDEAGVLDGRVRTLVGDAREARLGWSVAVGRLDGDAQLDLVLAAPGADPRGGAGSVGVVYALRGPLGPGDTITATQGSALIAHGAGASDGDGGLTVVLADTNGDGHDDLHIGLPDADPRGRSSVGEIHRLAGPLLADLPTALPSATLSPTPTPTARATATAQPTATILPSATTTPRPAPSATPTASATVAPLPGPSTTATMVGATATATPTSSPVDRAYDLWLPLLLRGR
jgi:cell division septation protein DedD